MFTHIKGLVLLRTGSFCVTGNSQLHKRHERAKDAHKVRLTVYLQGSDSSGLVFKEGMR